MMFVFRKKKGNLSSGKTGEQVLDPGTHPGLGLQPGSATARIFGFAVRFLTKLKLTLSSPRTGFWKFLTTKKGRRILYLLGAATLLLMFIISIPDPLITHYYSPVLYSREGELLGAMVALDGQWRFPPKGKLNEKFAYAIIEYEDSRFRYHPGVDPAAIGRAVIDNISSGKIVSGGSTITMQTIRLIRSNRKRTFLEKGIEAVLAIRLEIGRSKDEILSLYAANAPFGGNVVGLEAAAWRWFGRSAEELSWAEAATLAVLPNSPSLVHPGKNRDVLKQKRDELLEKLCQKKYFDPETLYLAKMEPLPLEPRPLPRLAPHLLTRIIRERGGIASFYGQLGALEKGEVLSNYASHIETTIDKGLQERMTAIINRRADQFSKNGIVNAACLIMDTKTGEILAYVGNGSNPMARDVDIIGSARSSGSTLKPFLYAAMLDSGDTLPASLISDIPTRIGSYGPENMSQTYLGAIPANQALARSLNVPAVRSLRVYGVARFARLLRTMGITTLFREDDDYGLPLILGGAEVTLWDLSGMYAGLARTAMYPFKKNSQFFAPSYYVRDLPEKKEPSPVSAGAAYITLDTLCFINRPGEESLWQEYASSRRIAWKTGTSFGFRDAWAIGTTPEWTIGVWIGNATGEGRAELNSSRTSATVLFEIFSTLKYDAWFAEPMGALKSIEVCAKSGFQMGPDCEKSTTVTIPWDALPQKPCPYCKVVTLNQRGDRQVSLTGSSNQIVQQQKWFILPPAEEWYYRRWNLDYQPLPSMEGAVISSSPIALFNPEYGAQIYVPIELDGSPGRTVFKAAHRDSNGIIHWHLDNTYLGATEYFHEIETRPSIGKHTITLVDDKGNRISRIFEVLSEAD